MTQEYSKHRIEGLTDGVFAIAMTLLVLEIHVPGDTRDSELLGALELLLPQLFAFVLTFILAAGFWWLSHCLLHLAKQVSNTILFSSLAELLVVSLLPLSTAVLGRHPRSTIALEIYYGHQVVLSGLLAWQWIHIRDSEFRSGPQRQREAAALSRRFLVLPIACIAALATAGSWPASSHLVFVVFALGGVAVSSGFRRRA